MLSVNRKYLGRPGNGPNLEPAILLHRYGLVLLVDPGNDTPYVFAGRSSVPLAIGLDRVLDLLGLLSTPY